MREGGRIDPKRRRETERAGEGERKSTKDRAVEREKRRRQKGR